MTRLPNELLFMIFERLKSSDAAVVSYVNYEWHLAIMTLKKRRPSATADVYMKSDSLWSVLGKRDDIVHAGSTEIMTSIAEKFQIDLMEERYLLMRYLRNLCENARAREAIRIIRTYCVSPHEIQYFGINYYDHSTISLICIGGSIELLQWLCWFYRFPAESVVARYRTLANYSVFVHDGNLDMMKYFVKKLPEEFQKEWRENLLCTANEYNRSGVLKWLVGSVTPTLCTTTPAGVS